MITRYDMQTGETLDDSGPEDRDSQELMQRQALQLRLLDVHEAAMTEQRIAAAAPALIMLPVDYLLGR